jgi:deoxyhypusine synthase
MADPKALRLQELKPLDIDEIENCDQLIRAMSRTAFGGRNLGEALDVFQSMVEDPDCFVVGTFSGAMTVAKMQLLLCRMIDHGWVNAVVSTGALIAHGFIESLGMKHYKYEQQKMDDAELYRLGLNRVYDTLESELNFIQAENVLNAVMEEIASEETWSSRTLCRIIGRHLSAQYEGKGILKSAYEQACPVYIPAFTDSEIALDMAAYILKKVPEAARKEVDSSALPFHFNPFLDVLDYARRITRAERIAIFTIGGGAPRNWAQQVSPFVEMAVLQNPEIPWEPRRFQYGVRICPEPDHWGGLSGCTYQEGISWGKFLSPKEGGRFAEVYCDATIAWPLLVKGLAERLG